MMGGSVPVNVIGRNVLVGAAKLKAMAGKRFCWHKMMSVGCGPQAAGQEGVTWRDRSASTEVQNYITLSLFVVAQIRPLPIPYSAKLVAFPL